MIVKYKMVLNYDLGKYVVSVSELPPHAIWAVIFAYPYQ